MKAPDDRDILKSRTKTPQAQASPGSATAVAMTGSPSFEFLAENISDAISRFDRDLQIRYMNPAFQSWFEEPRTVIQILQAPLLEAFQRGEAISHEWTLAMAPRTRHFISSFFPERDSTSAVRSVIVVHREFTERKRLQAQQRKLEAQCNLLLGRLQLQLDRMPIACILSNDDFNLTYWNPAAERLFGYSRAEAVGRKLWDFMPEPGTGPDVQKIFNRLRTDESSTKLLSESRSKNGSAIACEWHHSGLREVDGRFGGVLSVAVDITERLQLQEKLRLSERLTSLGTLAAGVAHEINNPLTYVLSNLEILGESEMPATSEENRRCLSDAMDGVQKVRQIVKDLKFLSRTDDESLENVDLVKVVESSVNMMRNEIRHRAKLVREFDEVPPVLGNASRFAQVFLNLIHNAAQSLPEGAADQHTITVAIRQEGDRVIGEVRDTGCGISEENRKRLFDPFFTTKPAGIGTGLGLSICHGIIAGAGGEFQVESELGKGSVFRVLLPAVQPGGAPLNSLLQAPQFKSADPLLATLRILIIDDDPLVAHGLLKVISQDFQATSVSSGAEALRRFGQGEQFDVILCDLMMPVMTGMDFDEQVGKLFPDLRRRIVFLTGGVFTPNVEKFLKSTSNVKLEKPCTGDSLRAAILKVVLEGGI